MYSLTYKWIDKLRISDKYSKPIFNEVQSIFIENIGRLAVLVIQKVILITFVTKLVKNIIYL